MKYLQPTVLAGMLAMASAAAWCDETDAMFDALFAEQLKAVKATREHADDLKLAEQMLVTVRSTDISSALTVRICEQAYALAAKGPTGTETALAAMRLLARKAPAKRAEARQKINHLLVRALGAARGDDRKQVAATLVKGYEAEGDRLCEAGNWKAAAQQYELAGRYASSGADRQRLGGKHTIATVNARVVVELVQLTARVKSNPRDRSARERIMVLHLTYNDSPAEAAKWLSDECSEAFRRHIPLASGELAALTSADCAALAKWYGQLLDQTGQVARVSMMIRVRRYIRMFLAAKDIDTSSREKAVKALAQIESAIKRAGRADLLTDEKLPAPRGLTVQQREPDDKGTPRGARGKDLPPSPPRAMRLQGPRQGVVLTAGNSRTFAKGVSLRENAGFGRHHELLLAGGAVLTDEGPSVYEACRRTSQLTIAAIITPTNVTQGGPARIVTLSSTANHRNFTLGQEGHLLVLRLRTSGNGSNGANHQPTLCTVQAGRPYTVVVTYAKDMVNCYVNGRHVMKTDKVRGDFRNWDSRQKLMFGDELDVKRYWYGIIHSVRIYSRALSEREAVRLSTPR